MSLLDLAPACAILLFGCVLVGMPVLRMSGLVTLLLLARTASDLGSTSASGLALPATALNAAIALALVGLLLVPGRKLSSTVRRLLVAALLLVLLGTMVGVLRYGGGGGSLQEGLRLVSVLAVFVLGARLPVDDAATGRQVGWLAVVPAFLLVGGALLGLALTLQSNGRAAGTFSHANAAAAYLAVAALVSLAWWLRRRRAALAVGGVLCLVGLGLTESLGGLAGFGAAALLLVVASSRASLRRVVPLVGLLVIVWAVVSTTGVGDRVSRVLAGSSASENGDSLQWRFLNWRLLLERWHEHPWFGFGLGSTRDQVTPLDAPPHSLPVQVLLETGVVGAVAVATLALVVVGLLVRQLRTRRQEAVLALSLLLLAVVNGAESNLLNYTPALYLVALVLGRLMVARTVEPESLVKSDPAEVEPEVSATRAGRPFVQYTRQ